MVGIKREGEHIGGLVFLSVFFVYLPGFALADESDRQGIFFPQNIVFDSFIHALI